MKRKSVGIIVAVGLLVVAVLAFVLFVMMPRYQRMMGSGASGPGMMGGGGKAAGGLIAVSLQGTPIQAPADSLELPDNTAAQKVGSLNVTLALSPYPPLSFQPATFEVTLTDDNGQPVSDASVVLDLTMPEMPMPSNQVEAKYTDAGLYQGPGRFTMRGWWRIEVIIQQGGAKNSAFFDVWL
jgi:hypothetical protein